jgi:hypothetical protein
LAKELIGAISLSSGTLKIASIFSLKIFFSEPELLSSKRRSLSPEFSSEFYKDLQSELLKELDPFSEEIFVGLLISFACREIFCCCYSC